MRPATSPRGRGRTARRSAPPVQEEDLPECDLALVRGQEAAKRALEVAVAGGHHALLNGPPGAGKSMLGRCIPGLLPPLTPAEAEEIASVYRLAGLPPPSSRPFRRPRQTAGPARLVGSCAHRRPGEVSLAHHGVLFLDELPAFGRRALEALCEPLEEGEVRFDSRPPLPARFALLATRTPCPCGYLGDSRYLCLCSDAALGLDRSRVPGALLDRIHLHVKVPALTLAELRAHVGESSATVAGRIAAARAIQAERFGSGGANGAMSARKLRRHGLPAAPVQSLIEAAFKTLRLSARAIDSALKVARTIADLAGSGEIQAAHLAEAVQYAPNPLHREGLPRPEEAGHGPPPR